jgi:hypothetical protein
MNFKIFFYYTIYFKTHTKQDQNKKKVKVSITLSATWQNFLWPVMKKESPRKRLVTPLYEAVSAIGFHVIFDWNGSYMKQPRAICLSWYKYDVTWYWICISQAGHLVTFGNIIASWRWWIGLLPVKLIFIYFATSILYLEPATLLNNTNMCLILQYFLTCINVSL